MENGINNIKLQDTTHLYLKGKLKGKELKAFEEALQSDETLQKNLAFTKELQGVIVYKQQQKTLAILTKVMEETPIEPDFGELETVTKDESVFLNFNNLKWLTVGVIASALSLFWFLNNSFSKFNYSNLTEQHLIPFENVIGTGTLSDENLNEGMIAYQKNNYQLASKRLNQYLLNKKDDNIAFYSGISSLLNGNPSKAIQLLHPLAYRENFPFANVAKWYTAIAFLENGNKDDSINLLKQLKKDIKYKDQALELLKILD